MNKLISVEERLPEFGEQCLLIMAVKPNIERGVYRGDGVWGGNWSSIRRVDSKYLTEKVTHWIPLPEILKEDLWFYDL